jgi:hypothetical protein
MRSLHPASMKKQIAALNPMAVGMARESDQSMTLGGMREMGGGGSVLDGGQAGAIMVFMGIVLAVLVFLFLRFRPPRAVEHFLSTLWGEGRAAHRNRCAQREERGDQAGPSI